MDDATKDESGSRLQHIKAEIAKSARLARRKQTDIHLIAVSKTRSAGEIRPLLNAGQRLFGENRVQEATDKWPALRTEFPSVELHLIGQLQSNKADEAVALFDAIHSLDRISLITALGSAMHRQAKPVSCFIQVNIGAEEQKGGCAIDAVGDLFSAAIGEGIRVAGLMCLPPAQVDAAPYFALLAEIAARHDLHQLSMGMSDDFGSAIMLGATHIRIGTALFGPRRD
jgi:PLP dependent protein